MRCRHVFHRVPGPQGLPPRLSGCQRRDRCPSRWGVKGFLCAPTPGKLRADHIRAAARLSARRCGCRPRTGDSAYVALEQMYDGDGKDAEAAQVARVELTARSWRRSVLGQTWLGGSTKRANYCGLDPEQPPCHRPGEHPGKRFRTIDLAFVWLNLGLCYAAQGNWPMAQRTHASALPYCRNEDLQAEIADLEVAMKNHPEQEVLQKSSSLLMQAMRERVRHTVD